MKVEIMLGSKVLRPEYSMRIAYEPSVFIKIKERIKAVLLWIGILGILFLTCFAGMRANPSAFQTGLIFGIMGGMHR